MNITEKTYCYFIPLLFIIISFNSFVISTAGYYQIYLIFFGHYFYSIACFFLPVPFLIKSRRLVRVCCLFAGSVDYKKKGFSYFGLSDTLSIGLQETINRISICFVCAYASGVCYFFFYYIVQGQCFLSYALQYIINTACTYG